MPLLPPLASLPLPLILLLIITIHYTCSANSNPCASSSPCGNITISYPFSRFDQSTTKSSYCGYSGLQVYCYKDYQHDIPLLPLGAHNYTITKINYDPKTISLVDADILLQDIPDHIVSLTPNIWLNYTELVINITFFLNCLQFTDFTSNEIKPAPAGTMPGKHTYVFPTAQITPNYNHQWAMMCNEVVIVPVLGPVVESKLPNLGHNYKAVLAEGFQLEWGRYTSKSEDCLQCEEKGGQCGFNVTSNSSYIPTCFCSNGSCSKYHIL